MANFSLYVSGQTEQNDVTEFFQKRLIGEGEHPIAFFDGVFYESHQERVGNIVFQDYLIYTDKAVYLWARGSAKDYLDRFTLGTVSINSRNKDSAFATLNLKIRRENKEPIYVIFDMVEIQEAETITRLHTVVESTIEDHLGVNFRQEIPLEIANSILQAARKICPPRPFNIPLEMPQMPTPDAGIGYGHDLLEQYKASIGYQQQPGYQQPGASQGAGQPADGAGSRGLESMLPTDPASLKRIAGQLRDMVGDAPFKLRDQVMKDLQHVPNDVATILTALNELLANIAGNPHAERFVMNAIKTAVSNDGMLGSVGKIIKLASGGRGGRKPARPSSSREGGAESRGRGRDTQRDDQEEESDNTVRRKKISILDEDDHGGGSEPLKRKEPVPPIDDEMDTGIKRKKISVRRDEDASGDNEIARRLMSYDESERDNPVPPGTSVSEPESGLDALDSGSRRKKLLIKADEESGVNAEIARKLMRYDESVREESSATASADQIGSISGETISGAEEDISLPRRKKIQIRGEEDDLEFSIDEELVMSAIGDQESPVGESGYMPTDSDDVSVRPAMTAMRGLQNPKEVSDNESAERQSVENDQPEKDGNPSRV